MLINKLCLKLLNRYTFRLIRLSNIDHTDSSSIPHKLPVHHFFDKQPLRYAISSKQAILRCWWSSIVLTKFVAYTKLSCVPVSSHVKPCPSYTTLRTLFSKQILLRSIINNTSTATTTSAEQKVQIITEPCSKRHMPASPELCDRYRNIRIIEVFEEMESKHSAESNRHIAIVAEIEEYL